MNVILRLACIGKKYYKNNTLPYKNDKNYVGFVGIIPAACFKVVFSVGKCIEHSVYL
jgi:hypothetical protein